MSLESFDRELERKRSCLEFSLKNSKHCETGLKPNKRKLIIPARLFKMTQNGTQNDTRTCIKWF